MSETYANVDASVAPADAARWQARMSEWPAVKAYKARTYELLADSRRTLDIGCGPGVDLVGLGVTRSVGVERSAVMAQAAASRGATVCRGDAHALPFAPASFGGARADRVFQHLADPVRALDEMLRVVEPGGAIVVADPDQETLAIQVPGVRSSVLDRLKALRRDVGYRNGRLAAQMPGLMHSAGARGVTVDAFPLTITDPQDAFGLPTWPEHWRSEGGFTDDEIREWSDAMRARADGFLYVVTMLVVAGHRPE